MFLAETERDKERGERNEERGMRNEERGMRDEELTIPAKVRVATPNFIISYY